MLLRTLIDSTRRNKSQPRDDPRNPHYGLLLQDPSLEYAPSVSERRREKAGRQ